MLRVSEPQSGRVLDLEPVAAVVFRHADGSRTVSEITALLRAGPDVHATEQGVWEILDVLTDAGLLVERAAPPSGETLSRRSLFRYVAAAGAAAMVLAGSDLTAQAKSGKSRKLGKSVRSGTSGKSGKGAKAGKAKAKKAAEQKAKQQKKKAAEQNVKKAAEQNKKNLAQRQKAAEQRRKLAQKQKAAEQQRKLAQKQKAAEQQRKLAQKQKAAEQQAKLKQKAAEQKAKQAAGRLGG